MKQMDASDRTRYIKTKTLWYNYVNTNLGTQPTCNYSTCGSTLTSLNCKVNYVSYEQREDVTEGRKNVSSCTNLCF
jgi:hypothetical protein